MRFVPNHLTKIVAPLVIAMLLAMMMLPLPPLLLDILFTLNLAISLLVLMVSLQTRKPLDFSAFPAVLLITTLMRLSLNVASSRVVLLEGHTGPSAAGHIIEAFGSFLVGGNFAVGFVIFAILSIINFVVVTKGAGRIAEVAARFTLDAMPGKQMAIDAELNAGLIDEQQARARRATVAQEAEFFGAMDGASKFVRGDAIAGILIVAINVLGGLAVGTLQHDLGFQEALSLYTLLAIGDGLVAQLPALLISVAAGFMVSRVSDDAQVGDQVHKQLFSSGSSLILAGLLVFLLGILPGMPLPPFLLVATGFLAAAYSLSRQRRIPEPAPATPPEPETLEVGWSDVPAVDLLRLEIGYRLIPLVDEAQGGELLPRIRQVRLKFAQDLGMLVPAVHIRDNLELGLHNYRILIKGVILGEGQAIAGQYLAINAGNVLGELPGQKTQDPAFGLPAVWIAPKHREMAQGYGYTTVDATTVVTTHLSSLIQQHAAELLGREEVQQLLQHLSTQYPRLVEEVTPKLLPLTTVQKVLQGLLAEGIQIRDLRTILEALAEHAGRTQDIEELTTLTRVAMGRFIVQSIYGNSSELQVAVLEAPLEQLLLRAVQSPGAPGAALEPGLADTLLAQARSLVAEQDQLGQPAVVLVTSPLRTLLARFLRRAGPGLHVLSHDEIPDNKSIQVKAIIGSTS